MLNILSDQIIIIKITRGDLEDFLRSVRNHANKYEKKEDNNSNNDNHQQKDDIQENIDNIFKNINDFHLKDIIGKEIERRLMNQFNEIIFENMESNVREQMR